MKKKLFLFSLILASSSLIGCNNNIPTEVKIIGPEFIGINNEFNYKVETNPVDAKKEVEWSIDNTQIASIDQNGKLNPIKEGIVNIRIKAKGNMNLSHTLKVNIYTALNSSEEFLNKYKIIHEILLSKNDCNVSIQSSDFIISTYGKVTSDSFNEIKFINDGIEPKIQYKFKDIEKQEKTDSTPITPYKTIEENFKIIKKVEESKLYCLVNDNESSYFSYVEKNNNRLYEFKSFDNEGYLTRSKEVLEDKEGSLQTIEDFHFTYNKN